MLAAGIAVADDAYVSGTALYRERIRLPPNAVFEAILQDVSRADAPAVELGRVETADPDGPPYNFRIAYDRDAISDRQIYAVRAAIRVDGRLMFTTDTFHPVLTGGAPDAVEIVMVRAGGAQGLGPSRSLAHAAPAPPPPDGAEGAAVAASEPAAETDAPPLQRGYVTFMAEAARFTDCATGREYLVAETGDFAALEHAYVAAGREPGGPVMVSFEGEIIERPVAGNDSPEMVVHVERFVGVWAGEACVAPVGNRPLVETHWRIVRLRDSALDPEAGQEPPRLRLQAVEGPRFSASVGCNSFEGGFDMEGERLTFGRAAATLVACPPPLDTLERQLAHVLGATRGWRIAGDRLEVLDADGAVIGEMEAAEAD
jgi:uncharacterized lipoprotein YbaY/heat shock protein HslJ